jgi:hypothetical protein
VARGEVLNLVEVAGRVADIGHGAEDEDLTRCVDYTSINERSHLISEFATWDLDGPPLAE